MADSRGSAPDAQDAEHVAAAHGGPQDSAAVLTPHEPSLAVSNDESAARSDEAAVLVPDGGGSTAAGPLAAAGAAAAGPAGATAGARADDDAGSGPQAVPVGEGAGPAAPGAEADSVDEGTKEAAAAEGAEAEEEEEEAPPPDVTEEEDAAAGRSEEEADRLKAEGNSRFSAGEPEAALSLYEEAVAAAPLRPALAGKRAAYHANRAACLLRLERFEQCVAACDDCLDIDPGYVKAMLRRVTALERLGMVDEALQGEAGRPQGTPRREQTGRKPVPAMRALPSACQGAGHARPAFGSSGCRG